MNEIEDIVYRAVLNALPEMDKITKETTVFGPFSDLDSLGLVGLLIEIEQKVYDTFNKEITIASEKAMSQTRSPFRNVQSLIDFVKELCES